MSAPTQPQTNSRQLPRKVELWLLGLAVALLALVALRYPFNQAATATPNSNRTTRPLSQKSESQLARAHENPIDSRAPSGPRQSASARPTAESPESLAARDPLSAIALALTEREESARIAQLQTVLRVWAATDAAAASNWALTHEETIEQGLAFSVIFDGTKQNPAAALRLVERLSLEKPDQAGSYGSYFIFSMSQAGQFELAAAFATNSAAEIRTDLLAAAFINWASEHPEQAVHAALALADPEKQNTAFHSAIDGWARTDPQTLTKAAENFTEGHDRTFALTAGLRSWIEKEPAVAAEWVAQNKLTAKEAETALEE